MGTQIPHYGHQASSQVVPLNSNGQADRGEQHIPPTTSSGNDAQHLQRVPLNINRQTDRGEQHILPTTSSGNDAQHLPAAFNNGRAAQQIAPSLEADTIPGTVSPPGRTIPRTARSHIPNPPGTKPSNNDHRAMIRAQRAFEEGRSPGAQVNIQQARTPGSRAWMYAQDIQDLPRSAGGTGYGQLQSSTSNGITNQAPAIPVTATTPVAPYSIGQDSTRLEPALPSPSKPSPVDTLALPAPATTPITHYSIGQNPTRLEPTQPSPSPPRERRQAKSSSQVQEQRVTGRILNDFKNKFKVDPR
jgi:hypothetical protein